jgi:hypothetical protein
MTDQPPQQTGDAFGDESAGQTPEDVQAEIEKARQVQADALAEAQATVDAGRAAEPPIDAIVDEVVEERFPLASEEPEPTLEEVQAKLHERLPVTAAEREVAARAKIFLPPDYPTSITPIEPEAPPPPQQQATLYERLAALPIETRIARLEKLQQEELAMRRNLMAEIGRAGGIEHVLNAMMERELAPEVAMRELENLEALPTG